MIIDNCQLSIINLYVHTVVIADAHLDDMNQELELFLEFLSFLQEHPCKTLYILGDLFTLWLGTPKLTLTHQPPVIQALCALKAAGIQVNYVEGNRDYFLAPLYLNAPFQQIAAEALQETVGGRRVYFAHGDLVNVHDRQYRIWRRFSRNPRLFSLFNAIPRSLAVSLAHLLEQHFRETNRKHKSTFPEDLCRAYAETHWKRGIDLIILGHFHEEHVLSASLDGKPCVLHVLPAWKETHEYLRLDEEGKSALHAFQG